MTQNRIMLVEDEGLIAADLESRLGRLGYEVAGVVDSGEDAVKQAHALAPDLILMDIRLRGPMDGIEAAEHIRARSRIPVVLLTSYADADTLRRAVRVEPLGYLVKPFDELELNATIRTALERHLSESRLRRAERWLATTLESIGDGVVATDHDCRVLFLNPEAERLTGWNRADAVGVKLSDVLMFVDPDTNTPIADPARQAITQGEAFNVGPDVALIHRSGQKVPVEDSAAPIRDERGQVNGAVIVFRDASERKKLEEDRKRIEDKIRESQRLESLGVMAGGIAHDFNNLLTTILGNSSLGESTQPAGSPAHALFAEIKHASRAAADLCRQLLAYSGKSRLSMRPLDLGKLVSESVGLIRLSIGRNANLELDLSPDPLTVLGDATQMRQVIMNLVINASEALAGEPGRIRISTGSGSFTSAQVASMAMVETAEAGEYIYLEVADTGCGMAPEVLARIFDPFFTTKFSGRGLGLAAALGIVRGHRGLLKVDSEPGKGTTFRLLFPRSRAELRRPDAEKSSPPKTIAAGPVLIVDDEPAVRRLLRGVLRDAGYSTLEATDGQQALAICAASPEPPTGAIVDLTMPEMGGTACLAELRRLYPGMPVLLTSGYSEDAVGSTLAADRLCAFLSKPFTPEEVLLKLKEAMDRARH